MRMPLARTQVPLTSKDPSARISKLIRLKLRSVTSQPCQVPVNALTSSTETGAGPGIEAHPASVS